MTGDDEGDGPGAQTPEMPSALKTSPGVEEATAWFEPLYAAAAEGRAVVPWDRGAPHPLLVDWAQQHRDRGLERRTLVVGTGLGEDAAFLAGLGFRVIAFDISASAIATARRRFPAAPVDFRVANLLEPPAEWRQRFDLVFECYTVQALPVRLRPTVLTQVCRFVAPGGTLLLLASARDERDDRDDEPASPPWPLTRTEIDSIAERGLEPVAVEEFRDIAVGRHWRAEFTRRVA